MHSYVLRFQDIDNRKLTVVGGKGLNLGELSRIEGLRVPEGFCVTTEAFRKTVGQNEEFNVLLDQLSLLKLEDREQIIDISSKIRTVIEEIEIAEDIVKDIAYQLILLGEQQAYAVRSSATAEDLPSASFAGQQDTFLNVIGKKSILQHISRCWASLFTERAVTYRFQNGYDHRKVYLSVVVQRMVFPQASGILFTADPVTCNRKVSSIDASFGLGEALVSGLVNADTYKVREGILVEKKISTKKLAIYALEEGGTEERELDFDWQNRQTLTDKQILQLEGIGRRIEAYFSHPQDIEWCLVEDTLYIVQSRPITTLFPLPERNDGKNRIYMSIGHQQMMTEAIKPLGMSFFQLMSEDVPMCKAGGRLFVELTHDLASPIGRRVVLNTVGKNDPIMSSSILSLMERKEFMKALPRGRKFISTRTKGLSWAFLTQAIKVYRKNDPTIIEELMTYTEASIRELQQRIAIVSGDSLFSFILEDYKELRRIVYHPLSMGAIIAGVYARYWINYKMEKWLGEKNAADTLSQSVANNVTSEMGLALMNVSDIVRQYPAVMEYFQQAQEETFLDDLMELEGGPAVVASLQEYLEKYGMRCTGEIDITKPRWSEQPTFLIPMILSNIKNFEPDASRVKFEQGRLEAEQKKGDLLKRIESLPWGKRKAKKAEKMINILRHFIGYREYPKYAFIKRYFIYKQALLKEAVKLVQKGVIREKEDIYYLTFEELREVVRTNLLDDNILIKRKEEYVLYEKLTPPRLMTSEGEIIFSTFNTDHIPQGALMGVGVSSGIIEGRARVVLKMEEADLEEGDILVTKFTDPSWTPLFVSIAGLVTEVGGLMTHGAVIAREYGLPAVVGVDNATKQIEDGQWIRVNGVEGYIEML